jgi:small subunit ribosomal protein S17e
MGRIKTKVIKRITQKVFNLHKDDFKPDFKENKQTVIKFADIPSKKIRNIMAGYLARLAKQKQE